MTDSTDHSPSCLTSQTRKANLSIHTAIVAFETILNLSPSTPHAKASFTSIRQGSEYKTLGRWQTAIIFVTNEVGIGILSLPTAMQTLGLLPGILAIVGLGLGLLTTYTAYGLVQFYRRYPTVMDVVDCCQIIGGKPLAWICAIAFELNLALTCASACLTMSIALNTITEHAICTIAFIAELTENLHIIIRLDDEHYVYLLHKVNSVEDLPFGVLQSVVYARPRELQPPRPYLALKTDTTRCEDLVQVQDSHLEQRLQEAYCVNISRLYPERREKE